MRLHFVTVPIHGGAMAEEELNQFLASRRIIAVDRQLVADGARSAWAICITYVDGELAATDGNKKLRIDYREVLSDADFQVFAKLRELRKKLAERDGVPPYALFTNEQLADMVRQRVRSAASPATWTISSGGVILVRTRETRSRWYGPSSCGRGAWN